MVYILQLANSNFLTSMHMLTFPFLPPKDKFYTFSRSCCIPCGNAADKHTSPTLANMISQNEEHAANELKKLFNIMEQIAFFILGGF